jgi:molybdopterin synthase catalytic subunit
MTCSAADGRTGVRGYDAAVLPPQNGDDWLSLTADELPVAEAYAWAIRPSCGAVVLFSGTVRDHADGREGVEHLTYEAYDDAVVTRLSAIATEARTRWPTIGRIALLHRTGRMAVGESSVVVVVSTPHRAEAFKAGRYAIDALKVSVPIWKHETWRDGSAWGTGATPIAEARTVV